MVLSLSDYRLGFALASNKDVLRGEVISDKKVAVVVVESAMCGVEARSHGE